VVILACCCLLHEKHDEGHFSHECLIIVTCSKHNVQEAQKRNCHLVDKNQDPLRTTATTVSLFFFFYFIDLKLGTSHERFTFLRVKVSCLLPTAVSFMLLVPECSSSFRRSSREALEEHTCCSDAAYQTIYTEYSQRVLAQRLLPVFWLCNVLTFCFKPCF